MKFRHSITALALVCAAGAQASSHREAPYIGKLPQVDATDFYMFMGYEPGREDYVSFISNYIPVQAAYGGPNYFPLDNNALYEIHIDNDGDAKQDISFQFDFRNRLPENGVAQIPVGDESISSVLRNIGGITGTGAGNEDGLNHLESYRITVATPSHNKGSRKHGRTEKRSVRDLNTGEKELRKPFDYAGTKTFGGPGNYETYSQQFIHDISIPQCGFPGRVFVGQRNEAFKISLGEIFDLVNLVPIAASAFPGGVEQDPARNTLAQNNVTSISLEVHKSCLTGSSDVVGAWTSASLRQITVLNPKATFDQPELVGGAWTQVSRLGMPLVNELVIPYDRKDGFNGSHPSKDGQFGKFVTNPALPEILNILFLDAVNQTLGASLPTLAPTNFPRLDLVAAFLTGFPGVNAFDNGTPSEMLRLNTAIAPTLRADQQPLGLAAGDLAGFPNGRRPGDDVVDIALRVVMGALCHDLPLGPNGAGVNLGLCAPSDAAVGNVPFTDGAPLAAVDLNNSFPYLLTPYPGSPVGAPLPTPFN